MFDKGTYTTYRSLIKLKKLVKDHETQSNLNATINRYKRHLVHATDQAACIPHISSTRIHISECIILH